MRRHTVHIEIDEETHKKLKIYCVKKGETLKAVVKKLLLELMK